MAPNEEQWQRAVSKDLGALMQGQKDLWKATERIESKIEAHIKNHARNRPGGNNWLNKRNAGIGGGIGLGIAAFVIALMERFVGG